MVLFNQPQELSFRLSFYTFTIWISLTLCLDRSSCNAAWDSSVKVRLHL